MGGGEIWSQNIVDGMRAAGGHVTVLGYDYRAMGPQDGEWPVAPLTVETAKAPAAALRWGLSAVVNNRPYTVQKWIRRDYLSALRGLLADASWELLVLDHAGMAWLIDHIGDVPAVHVAHQAESKLYAQQAGGSWPARAVYRREATFIKAAEQRLALRMREVWTLSEDDSEYFRGLGAKAVRTLPVAGRPGWSRSPLRNEMAADVSILGSWTWQPNREGLLWFLREVRPRLPAQWRFDVAGKFSKGSLPDLPNVRFLNVIPDAWAFLQGAQRIAVPSISDVGVPLKLLDAIAAGPPVVTTPAAARHLGPSPPHVALANTPAAFAKALREAQSTDLTAGDRWSAERRRQLQQSLADALSAFEVGHRSLPRQAGLLPRV
jgi:glycosyltransferase involved in cell wall biosynthesis